MSFTLTVTLDVTGRRTVVIGGGREAVLRSDALLVGGADVTVVTPEPAERLVALADEGALELHRRGYQRGDLAGAFVAYVTREDVTPVERVADEARRERVLLSTLDDVDRSDFATPSVLRRGDLVVTVSTGGKAPALAKRLRRHLEDRLGPELGVLTELVAQARTEALPRTVPFAEWAARFELALADLDGLVARLADGEHEAVRDTLATALRTPTDVALLDELGALSEAPR